MEVVDVVILEVVDADKDSDPRLMVVEAVVVWADLRVGAEVVELSEENSEGLMYGEVDEEATEED